MTSKSRPALVQRTTSIGIKSQQRPQSTTRILGEHVNIAVGREGDAAAQGSKDAIYERTKSSRVESGVIVQHDKDLKSASPEPLPAVEYREALPRGRPDVNEVDIIVHDGSINMQCLLSVPGLGAEGHFMPMPSSRPRAHRKPVPDLRNTTSMSNTRRDARPKPYTVEVPAEAPAFHPTTYMDFYPWSGTHAEDVWSDTVIRQGYFDRAPPSLHKEIDTAKSTVFPGMKHKSGLHSLSNLFTNILAHRRSHGQITASSTFKPPPRVTLTDTRKETWLKELANPATSLRKLSRTIPHGIRGKQLLEQCWTKNIPTGRAVWLAKCVGANEIRATKRKGPGGSLVTGNESKWIRDWTVIVEQYIESVVLLCREDDWENHLYYAVRLAAHLYADHLLDKEHFLDWLVSSTEAANLARLPIWILVTQIYWDDLVIFRKHGRRLVQSLCFHLKSAMASPDADILAPLIERLSYVLRDLLVADPRNFLMPKVWGSYSSILMTSLASEDDMIMRQLDAIDRRNQQLLLPKWKDTSTPHHEFVRLLDQSILRSFTSNLARDCWQLPISRSARVSTLLEWSTSLHRPGVAKVYVGARLLRNWSRSGVDVSDAVLTFLGSDVAAACCSPTAIYHLISELARSGHFSASRYLQWLIARGGVRGPSDLAVDAPCPSRLLAELPINDLPDNIERIRNTMLSRADFVIDEEEAILQAEMTRISGLLPGLSFLDDSHGNVVTIADRPPDNRLSRAVKVELGFWLRGIVREHLIDVEVTDDRPGSYEISPRYVSRSAITLEEFLVLRTILEDIEDFSILADIIGILTTTDNLQVLVSLSETVDCNLETFAAIGAADNLFESLSRRLFELSDAQTSHLYDFRRAMAHLAARLPDAASVAHQLNQELSQRVGEDTERAYSSSRLGLAGHLYTSMTDICNEIEKMTGSGDAADTSTMERLFSTITHGLQAIGDDVESTRQQYANLLGRLRDVDRKYFDHLFEKWLSILIRNPARLPLSRILSSLISQNCMEFSVIIDACVAWLDEYDIEPRFVEETLQLAFGRFRSCEAPNDNDEYRLCIHRARLYEKEPSKGLLIVRKAIGCLATLDHSAEKVVSKSLLSPALLAFMQRCIISDVDTVHKDLVLPLISNSNTSIRQTVAKLIRRLLDPVRDTSPLRMDDPSACITYTMSLANELTLPFCRLELQLLVANDAAEANNSHGLSACLTAFEDAVNMAVATNNSTWIDLLGTLDTTISQHLNERAENLFYEALTNQTSANSNEAVTSGLEKANTALFICEATLHSVPQTRALEMVAKSTERCNELWHMLSNGDALARENILQCWLPLLLEIIRIGCVALDSSRASDYARCQLLLSLVSLLMETTRSKHSDLITSTFDLCSHLIDDLSDELRLQCARALKDKTNDARVCYLFGLSTFTMNWLQLNQKGRLLPYSLRPWELLSEPTPNVGENDTSLSLSLFQARKI